MRERKSCRFLAEGGITSACRNIDYSRWYIRGMLEVQGDLTRKDVASSFGLCLDKTKLIFSGKEIQKVQTDSILFEQVGCIDMQTRLLDFPKSSLEAC